MKKLQNPTTYFFQQAQNIQDSFKGQIQALVNQLIDKDKCQLCKHPYDTSVNVPRIMIHCGHTFCTPCLSQFYMNRRVRCPMCLKLVKHLDSLERLPINHTIFQHISKKQALAYEKQNKRPFNRDAGKFLFSEFERVQKQAHRLENPQRYDPDTGLPFCVFHPDRVEHFHCQSHRTNGCRVCIQIGHSKPDCKIIDLYNIDDPAKIQQIMNCAGLGKVSHVNNIDHIGNYGQKNKHLILGQYDGDKLLDDDDDDQFDIQEGRKSF